MEETGGYPSPCVLGVCLRDSVTARSVFSPSLSLKRGTRVAVRGSPALRAHRKREVAGKTGYSRPCVRQCDSETRRSCATSRTAHPGLTWPPTCCRPVGRLQAVGIGHVVCAHGLSSCPHPSYPPPPPPHNRHAAVIISSSVVCFPLNSIFCGVLPLTRCDSMELTKIISC